jgi:hypothetical protein
MISQLSIVILVIAICLLACAALIDIICDHLEHISTVNKQQKLRRVFDIIAIGSAVVMFFITFTFAGSAAYWFLNNLVSTL